MTKSATRDCSKLSVLVNYVSCSTCILRNMQTAQLSVGEVESEDGQARNLIGAISHLQLRPNTPLHHHSSPSRERREVLSELGKEERKKKNGKKAG